MTETVEKTANGAILYDKAIINQISDVRFTPKGWLHAEVIKGALRSGGRGNTMYVGNVPRQFVLRHYMRGGLVGKLVKDALVLAPICPHTLSDRPLVVSANASIDVRLVEHADTSSEVICDGRSLGELLPGDTLRITRAEPIAILIHPLDHDYYRILRSKLHWGRGNRGQSGDNSGAPNSGPASSDKPGDGVSG